jgi:hypothetical protein
MVRNELVTLLKSEIYKYLGIPYFRNNPKLKSSPLNAFVGKGNFHEIAQATISTAQKQNVDLLKFSNQQIYNFQKKNHIGIDCSGYAYHLLNFLCLQSGGQNLDDVLVGTDGKKGVRRVNANLLTSPPNAHEINQYSDIKTGDLIRMDQGRHVIVIIEKKANKIYYTHSSDQTQDRGVHLGVITLTDPTKTLDFQKWSDTTKKGTPYHQIFDPSNGDGIFRLNCLN